MKLLGKANDKWVVASISHYDCVTHDGLMRDGGQPHCPNYAGYTRSSMEGETVWFEVPQTFADLYNDYQFNTKKRKYGIWKRGAVKILPQEEWPNLYDPTLKYENAVWGTRGKDGDEKLRYVLVKDMDTKHLEAVIAYPRVSPEIVAACKYWLKQK